MLPDGKNADIGVCGTAIDMYSPEESPGIPGEDMPLGEKPGLNALGVSGNVCRAISLSPVVGVLSVEPLMRGVTVIL